MPPPVPRGERTQVMAAIGGIDIALWDIKGKAAGLPVYRLLGGENRPIFTYATGGYYRPGATDRDYGAEMAEFLKLGYRAVKLKTGAGTVAAEAERIGTVRRMIGDEPLLNARHERGLRPARLHRICPCGRAAPHLLARRAAALVSAAGRFRASWRRRRRSRWRMASAN